MAEQDAERVWQLSRGVLREAVIASGVKDVAAISLSCQGDAIIPVSTEGTALHPAILGMDYRSAKEAGWCAQQFGAFDLFRDTGMRPHAINSVVKVLWLRSARPEVFERAARIVTYADFILGKLGAEPVIDHTMASRTMAFNLSAARWDAGLLRRMGLAESLFSRPVPSGTPAGRLKPEISRELGLAEDPMLVTGGHDQTCAGIGAGLIREGVGLISTGTAEVLSAAFHRPALTRQMFDAFYPCYFHAFPGMYFTFALNHVGGILLKWFRDNFAHAEVAEGRTHGLDAYQLLDARMPAGPSSLMVVPHWNGTGTPWCDMKATGAILGLTMASTRHDVAKAILEGLTFELLVNVNTMKECGVRIDELIAAGGGAKSKVWLQLKADILNRPIAVLECREAACLGAALLAGTAAGVYGSLDEAVQTTVRREGEYRPCEERARQYAERFCAYERLYPTLKELRLTQ